MFLGVEDLRQERLEDAWAWVFGRGRRRYGRASGDAFPCRASRYLDRGLAPGKLVEDLVERVGKFVALNAFHADPDLAEYRLVEQSSTVVVGEDGWGGVATAAVVTSHQYLWFAVGDRKPGRLVRITLRHSKPTGTDGSDARRGPTESTPRVAAAKGLTK